MFPGGVWAAWKRTMRTLLSAMVLLGFALPVVASEPVQSAEPVSSLPMSWVPVLSAVYNDFKAGGIGAECHVLGVRPNQAVTIEGVRYEDLFRVGVGRSPDFYKADSLNDYMAKHKCGRSYLYYVDKDGKIISRVLRSD